ncbi:divergent polysaccharide deacetylase family protein [Halanaerobaculum tunisiense]
MRWQKISALLVSLLLVSLVVACTQQSQPVTDQDKPEDKTESNIKVDYESEVSKIDKKVDQILARLDLDQSQELLVTEKERQKVTNDYQFSWDYNHRKLEVPLFGRQGKLLSSYRKKIISQLEEDFLVISTSWQQEEKNKLTVKLGLAAQRELDLVTHKLEFVQQPPAAKMAVIIDDLGFNRAGTTELLSIERPLTLAVLPGRPYSEYDAQLVAEAGQELILHQPLEPLNAVADPGSGAINTSMSDQEIKTTLEDNLDQLPEVTGINHHMGSKASANKRVMRTIVEVLKKRGLYYVDSSTSGQSVGFEMARDHKLSTEVNYLFIDNIDQQNKIEEMILRLGKIALEKEELVVIGHVKKNTAQVLKETIPQLEDWGIKLVHASQLVD